MANKSAMHHLCGNIFRGKNAATLLSGKAVFVTVTKTTASPGPRKFCLSAQSCSAFPKKLEGALHGTTSRYLL
jgi:hypothetical protein